tara:strand:- start:584 stop:937 length:354 start_codon:yes stop_codon:yes gene_type:complete
MATTVYSGTGNVSHSNTSGGNQRILIYWLKIAHGSSNTMTIGSMTCPINEPQVYGLKLAINTYVSSNSSMTNTMTVASGDGTANGEEIPLECYIADGQVFSIWGGSVETYNFIVIDE